MKSRIFFVIVAAGMLGSCNSSATQSSPTLTATAATPAAPAKPGIFEQATDATWRVVTSPARLLPQKAAPPPPQTYDAPAALIVQRDRSDVSDAPSTQPAHP